MTPVTIFTDNTAHGLQDKLNKHLSKLPVHATPTVQYQHSMAKRGNYDVAEIYSAMVVA